MAPPSLAKGLRSIILDHPGLRGGDTSTIADRSSARSGIEGLEPTPQVACAHTPRRGPKLGDDGARRETLPRPASYRPTWKNNVTAARNEAVRRAAGLEPKVSFSGGGSLKRSAHLGKIALSRCPEQVAWPAAVGVDRIDAGSGGRRMVTGRDRKAGREMADGGVPARLPDLIFETVRTTSWNRSCGGSAVAGLQSGGRAC